MANYLNKYVNMKPVSMVVPQSRMVTTNVTTVPTSTIGVQPHGSNVLEKFSLIFAKPSVNISLI